jgi:hypothetical protein
MFLSKIWFILIALLAGVAVTMALVAPRPVVQKLALLEGQRLDRAQYAAEQMLKVDAHKWIDRIAKLGRDAIISEALDSASRGAGEITVIHRTVQDRLKALIPDLAGGGIETIVAVDSKGRVVARVGDNDKEYGDFVGGAEVVADALRGYLSDDVWGTSGKLRRIAAGPVLSKSRDRIVGGLYVGAETGPALADRLKKNLDVDVVLLLRGKVIASTKYATELASLSELIDQHSKQMEELKRTPAISVTAGADNLLVVAAPFPGQAGQQKAYYALVGMQPAKSDVASLLSNTSSDDLKWGHFPWIPLAGGVFAMIAFGLFLQRLEVETPVRNLRRELQQLARGEIHKIQDGHYGGRFGGLARDVNAAMERYTHAPGPQSETASKDLNAILGPGGAGQSFDLPSADSSFHGNTPPPAFGPPAASAFAPPPPPSFSPPPPPVFAPPPPFSAAAVQNASGGSSGLQSPRPAVPGWGPTLPTASDDADTRVVDLGENGTGERVGEEEDTHFKSVFDEFLATKKKCGESIAGLTLDKFKVKLRENKATLMSKHHCRTVRFSVYVKDGKTALKATPVRD